MTSSFAAPPSLRRLLMGGLVATATFVAGQAAGFDGYFDVTPPAKGVFYSASALGGWTTDISQGESITDVASIDTLGAPSSVTLTAKSQLIPSNPLRGVTLQGPTGAYAQMQIAAPSDGTFSFSYALDLTFAKAFVWKDGAWDQLSSSGSLVNLVVKQNDLLGFRVENDTFAVEVTIGTDQRSAALADAPPAETLTIRGLGFVPADVPVPEASTVTAGLALAGLAGWTCLRARRRA